MIETVTPDERRVSYFSNDLYELKFDWEILNVYQVGSKTYKLPDEEGRLSTRNRCLDEHHTFIEWNETNEAFFREFEISFKNMISSVNKFLGNEKKLLSSIKNNFNLLTEGKKG